MRRRMVLCDESGVTLLELVLAMALFAIVLGSTAQALLSYYVGMDSQEQRATASQHAQSLLSDMRQARDATRSAKPTAPVDQRFPGALFAQWPQDSTLATTAVQTWLRNNNVAPNARTLPQEQITVHYFVPAAPTTAAGAGQNPLGVQLTIQWRDMRGRPMQTSLSTILADR